jgi:Protein of unknown function (DUF1588)/Protein of unknown function (DUF1592)/Protein of unknown function (DUF1595)/Protein of unknown function (DUF1585)/Protein of unknown function (DUF1587)
MKNLTKAWLVLLTLSCSGKVQPIGDATPPVVDTVAGGSDAGQLFDGGIVCTQSPDFAATPMLRLTREQYANMVGALFATATNPQALLPVDESLGPFAVNGVALISSGLALQYQTVAEAIGTEVEGKVPSLVACGANANAAALMVCAEMYVARVGRSLFRRSLSAEEHTQWMSVYQTVARDRAGTSAQNHAAGVAAVVEGFLQSPSFLFRVERVPADYSNAPQAPFDLDDTALAARLALFLWNSAPDEELLNAAEAPEALTQAQLFSQAERLLKSPKAAKGFSAFTDAWGGLKALKSDLATGRVSHGLTPAQMQQLVDENRRFVNSVLLEGDGQLSTLLTATYTYTNPDLAKVIYGPSATPDATGRLELNPLERSGLLTNPAVLFAHSHGEVTSPVLRGKWVRETLLCQTIDDPPPSVNITPPIPQPGMSLKETYRQHSVNPSCSGCHKFMDPVGFGFEAHDEVGRFRTKERNGIAVNPSGELVGTDVDGPFRDALELGQKLKMSQLPYRCMAEQTYRYALGTPPLASDACLMDHLAQEVKTGTGFQGLLKGLVAAPGFSKRRPQ